MEEGQSGGTSSNEASTIDLLESMPDAEWKLLTYLNVSSVERLPEATFNIDIDIDIDINN